LDKAASIYANSSLSEQFTQLPWTWYDSVTLGNQEFLINCGYSSSQDAQLISLAWKCAAATHEDGTVEAIDGVSVNILKYVKPSMGGSVKAALVALVEQSPTPPSENQHLPVLVIAIRGSKSTVDFMVNANGESEDVQNLFVRASHSCILGGNH
jgi:hypothetical protein